MKEAQCEANKGWDTLILKQTWMEQYLDEAEYKTDKLKLLKSEVTIDFRRLC